MYGVDSIGYGCEPLQSCDRSTSPGLNLEHVTSTALKEYGPYVDNIKRLLVGAHYNPSTPQYCSLHDFETLHRRRRGQPDKLLCQLVSEWLSSEYQNTTHGTKAQGAFYAFNFVGTYAVLYYVTTLMNIEHQGDDNGRSTFPNTTYVLDDRSPINFFGKPPSTSDTYQQVFYSSPPLPYTNHTLVGTCADEVVCVDRLLVVEVPFQPDSPAWRLSANSKSAGVTVPAVLGALLVCDLGLISLVPSPPNAA
ncbi:GABA-specific high-affinity permease [Salix suchowensis]|nr:GABA-specific high-affinity permease [Salix suchowensis]